MDGVTSKRPAMLLRRPCRHRLGFTVLGGSMVAGSSKNAYASRSQSTCPKRPGTWRGVPGAIIPRVARSKSLPDAEARDSSTTRCASVVEALANLRSGVASSMASPSTYRCPPYTGTGECLGARRAPDTLDSRHDKSRRPLSGHVHVGHLHLGLSDRGRGRQYRLVALRTRRRHALRGGERRRV